MKIYYPITENQSNVVQETDSKSSKKVLNRWNLTIFAFLLSFVSLVQTTLAQTITTGTITGLSFCAGANLNVPYTKTGTFTGGNVFTAELSDASGSFASPVSIGTLASVNNGTIAATIPGGTATGTGYRIRVTGSTPAIIGSINASNLSIFNGVPGTPNTYGNGNWNAYVYNAQDYTTNYSGFFTTGASLDFNTTSLFTNVSAPSLANTYQGCQITSTNYSIRFQRTNFTPGVYRIGVNLNDDNMNIILDGVTVYTSGYNAAVRSNVWTGNLTATSQLEIRYLNNTGAGEINFTVTPTTNSTLPLGGTISGNQSTCATVLPSTILGNVAAATVGTCTAFATPYQWESSTDNITFNAISGANATTYAIPALLGQTTYYRRGYRTFCETVYSNTVTVTVYPGAMGTPGIFGNGLWNAYVYNATDYATNYSGYFTTGASLDFNTTSSFTNISAPSLASTYQGCPIGATNYSIRFQRTNFTPDVYRIGVNLNDDNMNIILDGVTIYTSGYNNTVRANVWTGTLNASSQLEIRYLNGGGAGEINFTVTPTTNSVLPTGGTISGNQSTCATVTPLLILGNTLAATAGTCNIYTTPYQWESSIDNITFNPIVGANATTYTILSPLSQTTYFRRAYRTFCETVYSNTITVTVYPGALGTPGTFGTNLWNAYVYNATDFTTNYSGYYTTIGTSYNFNSTNYHANNAAPSTASTYQGCPIGNTNYSIRLQRTGFAAGTYQIGVNANDDNMDIIIDGVTVYTSGTNGTARPNVWSGILTPTSQVEIRYLNGGGPGQIDFVFSNAISSPATGGTINGDQLACDFIVPSTLLNNVVNPAQGSCNLLNTPIQWQSSTDNVSFSDIAGANALTYAIPSPLSQTTYFRRAYRNYCDTAYSNTVTVTIYNGTQGTPGVYGNGSWNAYVYNAIDYTTNYTGYYTTGSPLSYNSNTDFANTANPSSSPSYQGCIVGSTLYSIRYQRTGFTTGTYQLGININDDNMDVLIDGVIVYSSGYNNTVRPNIWTGTLTPTSQVEIRYENNFGPGEISFSLLNITNTPAIGGTISGDQSSCSVLTPAVVLANVTAATQGSCSVVAVPYQWQSSTDNITFADIAGANATAYTIPAPLSQTTYFRRAYRNYCDTAYSNTVTVTIYNGSQGTPNVYGNGLWNAYVYNSIDYATNYTGYYTTGSALSYNSNADYANTANPSSAPSYQGCITGSTLYSIRLQRTGFTAGIYQIGININDDNMNIIIDGVTVYSSGYNPAVRPNVWTGSLNPSSQVEIRYSNNFGPGEINFTFLNITNTPATGGTISGNQTACNSVAPAIPLANVAAGVQGSCNLVATPYQWQSSTDNITFANISGANALAYNIPSPLSQTTYFRRAYINFCDTAYSNTVTVTIYNGSQGTPNTYGVGQWNAYVYNSTDFSTNYTGYYTTGSALSYNSTTDYANNANPSSASTYQGCLAGTTFYSIRLQRTGFTPGNYQIGVNLNDDVMDVLINGVNVYTSGYNTTIRPNIWTGALNASSQVEIRYYNNAGPGEINFVLTNVSTTPSTGGTISGNQSACSTSTPIIPLNNVVAATQGSCNLVATPYQWQSSTDNITYTNIVGANATAYTIPSPLSTTTYFRRAYRTFCDTAYSNVITVNISVGAPGTPGTFGNGVWNAYVYGATDYVTNYAGYYTTASPVSYNTNNDFGNNVSPSLASTYVGCQVAQNSYSVRLQRTNFTPGIYQIDIAQNDDGMNIILNGSTIYTSALNGNYRSNVWTGTLDATSQLEIRYANSGGGAGYLAFNIIPTLSTVAATPGTISGNQSACSTSTPILPLNNVTVAVRGTCSPLVTPYQWQSSIDNISFTNISGANATSYTIPGPLAQTTYFRRAYLTSCETVYSNVITVNVFGVAPGTPGTFGNGLWNAYVYGATDYVTNYSGYYTTGAALSYSTLTDFAINVPPSQAATYQGCQVTQASHSVRLQRTNFTPGTYQIDVAQNDDAMNIILNGVTIYTSGNSAVYRTNVWTGTLDATSQLEIRYNNNNAGNAVLRFNILNATNSSAPVGGTIAGNQSSCTTVTPITILSNVSVAVQGTCSALPTPYQWQSSTDNISFANIAGATATTYTIPTPLAQTTYFRRAYQTACETVYSNTITVTIYAGAIGTPNTYGNGLWNAYVYNATDFVTNYSGYYTSGASLSYNTTSSFATNAAPSIAATYQGCPVSQSAYSVRLQRTNFTPNVYQIDISQNDDAMNVILDGVTIYSSNASNTYRSNVWTGTLNATSQLEFRYANTAGATGYLSFNINPVVTVTPATGGTIAGNQNSCNTVTPSVVLTSSAAATAGSCTAIATPYQWQSSTDNISFANIIGANATTYTIPSPLAQTTYYRRAYQTACSTVYSNTITVTIFAGAQGTPNTFGNGLWNAYVYNATDYTTNYSGYYTTAAALTYNTTSSFANGVPPSSAATYQGCPVAVTAYSVRLQRTNFTPNVYQIDIAQNNDGMNIILDGVTIYTSGLNNTYRTNVWTGTLNATSQLEIRYANTAGATGNLSFSIAPVATVTAPTPGSIAGNQTACNSSNPAFTLTSVSAATVGTCTPLANAYQWQSSTDNVIFANISGANAATYTIPAPLSQTTYFRRAYQTACQTVYTNSVTVTVFSGVQGTPGVFGNGTWNAYVYGATDYSTNYAGYYTTPSALTYNTVTNFAINAAPSTASTYAGCPVSTSPYSIRFQRTNFTAGTYRIGVNINDDNMDIILNGITIYSSGASGAVRTNVWTGALTAASQLEIRYLNAAGSGRLNFVFTNLSTNTPTQPGSISGNQVACIGTTPSTVLSNSNSPALGSCALASPAAQWQSSTNNVNFTNIAGANALSYTIPSPLSQTTYYRRAYRSVCDTVYSNTVTVTVVSTLTPSVALAITTGSQTICTGTTVTFTATPTNGGTSPTYTFRINGTPVQNSASNTFTSSSLTNGNVVDVSMTSNATCAIPTSVSSNSFTMSVGNLFTPAVSISSNVGTTVCSGTNVTFTPTPTNGGSTPSFEWFINGVSQGISATLSSSTLSNGNVINAVMTSSLACVSPTTASSNNVTMTVNTSVTPTITISSSQTNLCTSGISFTSSISNGGSSPSYQWKLNGSNISGANSSTYSTSSLVNGDIITCQLTSNATCPSPAIVQSNTITVSLTGATTTWLGLTNDWSIGSPINWDNGYPSSNTTAIIPAGTPNEPQINDIVECYNIVIQTGASLTINGVNQLNIYGKFTNDGTFNAGFGNVEFLSCSGSSLQSHEITSNNGTVSSFFNVRLDDLAGLNLTADANIRGALTLTNGTFNNPSHNLTLISTVTGTARIAPVPATANYVGSITMQRYAPGPKTGWAQLGTPIQGATLAQWQDDFATSGYTGATGAAGGFISVYTYNESTPGLFDATGSYLPATNVTNSIPVGKGFWLYLGTALVNTANITIDVTGQPTIGNFSFNPSYTNSSNPFDDGFNLIANPYPSAIDWLSPNWTKTNINNAIYMYQADNGQYASFVGGISTNGGSRFIASSQGFYIQANGSSPVLNITENAKSASNPVLIREADPANVLRLKINGDNVNDEMVIHLNDNATENFDGSFDAKKMFSNDPTNPSISSVNNNKDLSINSLPFSGTSLSIPVRVTVGSNGMYNLSWSGMEGFPEGSCFVVEDLDNGNKTTLDKDGVYYFNATVGFKAPRFVIHISTPLPRTINDASCSNSQDASITVVNQSNVSSTVQLKDASGNIIKEAQVLGTYTFDKLMVGNYQLSYPNAALCGTMNQSIKITASNEINATFETSTDNILTQQAVTFTAPVQKGSNLVWNFGDGSQATGDFSVSHKYAQEGSYLVTLINNNGECSTEKSMLLNVTEAVSSEVEMDIQMINGNYYALFNFKDNTSASIVITNTLGQKINGTQIFEGKRGQVKLDLTGNADGIYLINLNDGKTNFTKKIVK